MYTDPKHNASYTPSYEIPARSTPAAPPSAPDHNFQTRSAPPFGVEEAAIAKRKKRDNMLNIFSLILRWLSFVFSLVAFIIMVTNRHKKSYNFEESEDYSYLLAITVISTVYLGYQGIREAIQLANSNCKFPQPVFAILDFIGDQILAYLLISAASTAVTITKATKEFFELIKKLAEAPSDFEDPTLMKFLDMGAASASIAFLAFFTLAFSVLISGYRLSAKFL